MKKITLHTSIKVPIPSINFSNTEARAFFEYEYDGEDKEALEYCQTMLKNCLDCSKEVAKESTIEIVKKQKGYTGKNAEEAIAEGMKIKKETEEGRHNNHQSKF